MKLPTDIYPVTTMLLSPMETEIPNKMSNLNIYSFAIANSKEIQNKTILQINNSKTILILRSILIFLLALQNMLLT